MTMRRTAIALLFLLASACGGTPAATLASPGAVSPGSPPTESSPEATSGQAAAASPASAVTPSPVPDGPTVRFRSPADGATVPAGDLAMTVVVKRFDVVDKIGNPPTPGEGHLVFYVG